MSVSPASFRSPSLSPILKHYKASRESFSEILNTLEKQNSLLDLRIEQVKENGFKLLSEDALRTEVEINSNQAKNYAEMLEAYRKSNLSIPNKPIGQSQAIENPKEQAEQGVFEVLIADYEKQLKEFNDKRNALNNLINKISSVVSEQTILSEEKQKKESKISAPPSQQVIPSVRRRKYVFKEKLKDNKKSNKVEAQLPVSKPVRLAKDINIASSNDEDVSEAKEQKSIEGGEEEDWDFLSDFENDRSPSSNPPSEKIKEPWELSENGVKDLILALPAHPANDNSPLSATAIGPDYEPRRPKEIGQVSDLLFDLMLNEKNHLKPPVVLLPQLLQSDEGKKAKTLKQKVPALKIKPRLLES